MSESGYHRELGYFTVAFSISSLVTLFTNAVVTAWLPWSMQHPNWDEYKLKANYEINKYICLSLIYILILFFAFPLIVELLVSNKYEISVNSVVLLTLGHIFFAIQQLYHSPLYKVKKIQFIAIPQGLSLVTLIALTFFLEPRDHTGASKLFMMSGLVTFLFTNFYCITLQKSFANYFPVVFIAVSILCFFNL